MAGLYDYLTPGKAESHVSGLDPEFNRRLLALMAARQQGISLYSGYRSKEHQARLFQGALDKYGSYAAARKHVAPPGHSQHNFGRAADLRYASKADRQWAHDNAAKYGLNFRMSWEPWHIEMVDGKPVAVPPSAPAPGDEPSDAAPIGGDLASYKAPAPSPGTETKPDASNPFTGYLQGLYDNNPMVRQASMAEGNGINTNQMMQDWALGISPFRRIVANAVSGMFT